MCDHIFGVVRETGPQFPESGLLPAAYLQKICAEWPRLHQKRFAVPADAEGMKNVCGVPVFQLVLCLPSLHC